MSTAAGADAVQPEATACWCCGTSYPELFLLHLNSRPDAVACLRCGEFLGRRARKPSRRADPLPLAGHPRDHPRAASGKGAGSVSWRHAGSGWGSDSVVRDHIHWVPTVISVVIGRVARATRIPGVRVHDVITLSSSTHRWATPPGTPSRPSSASVTPTHLPVVSHGVVQHPPERGPSATAAGLRRLLTSRTCTRATISRFSRGESGQDETDDQPPTGQAEISLGGSPVAGRKLPAAALGGRTTMAELSGTVDGLPNLSGSERLVNEAVAAGRGRPVFYAGERADSDPFAGIRSAFSIALHMHQPLIPAGGDELTTARLISNLQYMQEHPDLGDNHNAPVFRWCYRRMAEFVPQLLAEGRQPRVMLEYSGTLLWGLQVMGASDVLDDLRTLAVDPSKRAAVEFLGCPWGHAVAPSTPVQDFRLHVRAWQHHFASLFGLDALSRVRGFSPAEMALPNHPDVAYEFVRTLDDCDFQWVLVQEHTVETPDGRG